MQGPHMWVRVSSGAPKTGHGPGAGAVGGGFKFFPNASNGLPTDFEILGNGVNIHLICSTDQ